jgi:hypothetical protein
MPTKVFHGTDVAESVIPAESGVLLSADLVKEVLALNFTGGFA